MTTTFEEKIEMLQGKFFSLLSQADVNDISNSFIFLAVSSDSRISKDEMKRVIKWVKMNKVSDISEISNKALQADLTELISVLMSLFNAYVIHKYYSKQFKKTQTIVLWF